jgi:hypothetical protein
MWGGDTLTHTNDQFIILSDLRLQANVEHIRDCDYANRGVYNVQNGLYIGKSGLIPIATKFGIIN